jgi:hypothetical protein
MASATTSLLTQPRAQRVVLLTVVLAGAVAAWSMWWTEIWWIKGWNSMAWLSGYNWSAIPICVCIAAVSSIALVRSMPLLRRLYFVGIASLLMWAAFDIGRAALFELGHSWLPRAGGLMDSWLATLLLADLGVAFALFFCANKLLVPLRPWTGLLLFLALSAVAPLSVATIQLIPAVRGQTDAVHAVKMGYPVFWTALLVPLCLWLGRKARLDS